MSRFRRELARAVRPEAAARLIAQGHSKHVLDGPRWRQTSYGFRLPADGVEASPTQRIVEALAPAPAGAVLGGWAAAYALGADRLDGLDDHTMEPLPVPIFLPPGQNRQDRPEVRYRQGKLGSDDVAEGRDVSVTSGLRTGLDMARWAPDVTEAVVALDALLQAQVVRLRSLRNATAQIVGRRGSRQALQAIELCRPGVRSNWESRLRMVYVLDLSLDSPVVNAPVFDRHGTFLGAPDLLDEAAGLAIEYDGASWSTSGRPAGHRDREQHREDNVREELLERAGLIVVRADKGDITTYPGRLHERLRAARADGLQRDRRKDRWTLQAPEQWLGLPA